MKKVILLPNPAKDPNFRVARKVILRLHSNGAKVYVDKKHQELIWDEVELYTAPPTDADLCVVMGGDGSFLDATPFCISHDIPLVGINLGRLGFLSIIEPDKISLLDKAFKKNPDINKRLLLRVTVQKANGETKSYDRLAVNEVAFLHEKTVGMAEFSLHDDHGNAVSYMADGIILATPTGSSAYSLSAGGPLLDSGVEAICATPVCAHSFFNRSILFGKNATLTVRNNSERGMNLNLTIDGRTIDSLEVGDEAVVSVADKQLRTVEYPSVGMLNTLRRKMEAAELKKNN